MKFMAIFSLARVAQRGVEIDPSEPLSMINCRAWEVQLHVRNAEHIGWRSSTGKLARPALNFDKPLAENHTPPILHLPNARVSR